MGSYVLHKVEDNVLTILGDSQYTIGGIEPFYKISYNNCEAIALGYDLDDLADKCQSHNSIIKHTDPNTNVFESGIYQGFRLGFQKAIEILGDKNFSEDDMRNLYNYMDERTVNFLDDEEPQIEPFSNYIKSLQQTEWNVEIEMMLQVRHGVEWHDLPNQNSGNDPEGIYQHVPKLDSEGCIILKAIKQ